MNREMAIREMVIVAGVTVVVDAFISAVEDRESARFRADDDGARRASEEVEKLRREMIDMVAEVLAGGLNGA